ncbi:MAG: helix-hairpin-helix domain-containing protein [Candidatus Aenigmarchaeota archaeon]|nr:helix-hairpin-helix domain-containing protein [Candidatus Aenigmarchaeota archaeon]
MEKESSLKDLRAIPGVGKEISEDLLDLGYSSVSDLKGEDPEDMYDRLCRLRGMHIDRCMLYIFRCAVYFASNKSHDAEKLKWWNWKDRKS